jgi:hypothetical protein
MQNCYFTLAENFETLSLVFRARGDFAGPRERGAEENVCTNSKWQKTGQKTELHVLRGPITFTV